MKPLVCPFPQLPPIVGYAKTATIRTTHAHELDGKKQREQRIAYYEYIAVQAGAGHHGDPGPRRRRTWASAPSGAR